MGITTYHIGSPSKSNFRVKMSPTSVVSVCHLDVFLGLCMWFGILCFAYQYYGVIKNIYFIASMLDRWYGCTVVVSVVLTVAIWLLG